MRKAWQVVRMKTSTMNGYLHESLAGMRVTQAFVREKLNREMFNETNQISKIAGCALWASTTCSGPTSTRSAPSARAGVYVAGVLFMGPAGSVNGLMLADLLAILWYLGRFWEPINNMSNFYNSVLAAMASTERIFEIMDTKPLVFDTKDDLPELPPIVGEVTFDHVSFGYDPGQPVLTDVSFTVKPGQTIALVGPTGAGKSTVGQSGEPFLRCNGRLASH